MEFNNPPTKRKVCRSCVVRKSYPHEYKWCPFCRTKLVDFDSTNYEEQKIDVLELSRKHHDVKKYTTDELI